MAARMQQAPHGRPPDLLACLASPAAPSPAGLLLVDSNRQWQPHARLTVRGGRREWCWPLYCAMLLLLQAGAHTAAHACMPACMCMCVGVQRRMRDVASCRPAGVHGRPRRHGAGAQYDPSLERPAAPTQQHHAGEPRPCKLRCGRGWVLFRWLGGRHRATAPHGGPAFGRHRHSLDAGGASRSAGRRMLRVVRVLNAGTTHPPSHLHEVRACMHGMHTCMHGMLTSTHARAHAAPPCT